MLSPYARSCASTGDLWMKQTKEDATCMWIASSCGYEIEATRLTESESQYLIHSSCSFKALCMLTHLNLSSSLQDTCYLWSTFIDKETEEQGL